MPSDFEASVLPSLAVAVEAQIPVILWSSSSAAFLSLSKPSSFGGCISRRDDTPVIKIGAVYWLKKFSVDK